MPLTATFLATIVLLVFVLSSVLLLIGAFLLGFVLFGHVGLDKLRDEVAIGAVAVRHRAEPVYFVRALLQLLLRG